MNPRNLLILYGSSTGCAQELAEIMYREAELYYFQPSIYAMNNYNIELLASEQYVLFISCTSGQGEQPENMKKFWKFLLQKKLNNSNLLNNIKFACFGLGDSSYPLYNAVIRKLQVRLLQLGAKEFSPRGLGDDQSEYGYFPEFETWKSNVWNKLLQLEPLENGVSVKQAQIPIPTYKISIVSNDSSMVESKSTDNLFPSGDGITHYSPFLAHTICNKRISSSDCLQDIRHIEFDISGSNYNYSAGDVVLIHPRNDPQLVKQFITDYLHENPNNIIQLVGTRELRAMDKLLPSSCSLQELFELYLDLFGSPRRYFFEIAKYFCKNSEREAEKLEEFSSNNGQIELYKYSQREKRSYPEVLAEFPNTKIPLDILIHIIPRLQPRQFSISSSLSPHTIHITLAVLQFKTPLKRSRIGIASKYLHQLKVDQLVAIGIKQGSFKLPKSLSTPLILVGPGTGIAPFRSISMQRKHILEQNDNNCSGVIGGIYVYFGCRYSSQDHIYAKEFNELVEKEVIKQYSTAFSRDSYDKVYVQNLLIRDSKLIYNILVNENGYFLLAGAANQMPKDVKSAIQSIIEKESGWDNSLVIEYMKRLDSEKRYQVEVW